jgi:uncharacterized protein
LHIAQTTLRSGTTPCAREKGLHHLNAHTKRILRRIYMNGLDKTALGLVIVGALNWLLVGAFQWDLVAALFGGQSSALSRIVYSLVGLAGIYCLKLLAIPERRPGISASEIRRAA